MSEYQQCSNQLHREPNLYKLDRNERIIISTKKLFNL